LICTKDTGIVAIGGCYYSNGLYLGGNCDPFIVKTDYNGDTLWTWRAYIYNQLNPENGNTVYFSAVTETNEGNYIAVGYSALPIGMKTYHGPNGGILAKFSKNGELIYFKDFHDVPHTIFTDVDVDSQGNIIVFGDKINYEHEDSLGIENGLLVKFDAVGNVLFYRLDSSIKSKSGIAGCLTENDEILFIGWLIPPDELEWFVDTWLIKYTNDGEKLWEKIIGGKMYDDYLHKIQETSDNGLVLFGAYGETNQNFKAWIVKTDSLGNGVYEQGWQNSINNTYFINDVIVYPNPAHNIVTIELPDLKISFDLYIYNMTGQLVFHKNNNDKNCQIFVENYPEGIYIIKIQSDKMVYTGKLSVKH